MESIQRSHAAPFFDENSPSKAPDQSSDCKSDVAVPLGVGEQIASALVLFGNLNAAHELNSVSTSLTPLGFYNKYWAWCLSN